MHLNDFEYNNEDETAMGQLHAIHLNLNAVAEVRRKILSGPSLENCEICDDPIPEGRRLAISGCRTCVHCQTILDKQK